MQLNLVEIENLPHADEIWINKKTGHKYRIVSAFVTNTTNSEDGQKMVLYRSIESQYAENPENFVREFEEFVMKFEKEKS